ncbi:hypothetical protein [Leuconostoc pseudomesenteroides]|uniref:hypothetical protein n=1 Tax=Leuconostoc pseudomesenteroides TaxID=33968 RepID=UPI0022863B4C|nr:hypothetical protein [Leuconostoc pseudomesenteroides]WAM37849.1 hypothetical protein OYT93_06475 [Leuconostoc pseudomesenteroides]
MSKQIIKLSAERNDGTLYSYKEITNFTNNFNSAFFKALVLNTINNSEIEFTKSSNTNIWILDHSFQTNQQYKKLYNDKGIIDLSNGNGLKSLYHLGNPISFSFDSKSYLLNICFNFFSILQYTVNKNALVSPLNKDYFFDSLNSCLSDENASQRVRNLFEEFQQDYYDEIEELLKEENDPKVKQRILSTKSSLYGIFNSYINMVKSESIQNHDAYAGEETFYKNFRSHSQPIVGIKKANELFICGWQAISREMFVEDNDYFFETRLIKQQSPLSIELALPLTIIAPFLIPAVHKTWERASQQLLKEQQKSNPNPDKIDHLENKVNASENSESQISPYSNTMGTTSNNYQNKYVGKLADSVTDDFETAVGGDDINITSVDDK